MIPVDDDMRQIFNENGKISNRNAADGGKPVYSTYELLCWGIWCHAGGREEINVDTALEWIRRWKDMVIDPD